MALPPTWRRFEGFEEAYLELGDEDKDLSLYLEQAITRLYQSVIHKSFGIVFGQ